MAEFQFSQGKVPIKKNRSNAYMANKIGWMVIYELPLW